MNSRLCCNPEQQARGTSQKQALFLLAIVVGIFACVPRARAGGDAPPWMHALVNSPLPAYDDKTDAVLLYSETNVTVLSADKIRTQVREAYKILRPSGRDHGTVLVHFNPQRKVKSLHGWCIPAQGKDYEVKDKDALEMSLNTQGGELVSDVKYKVLHVPAPDPGNIIGYEYEVEEQPFFLQDIWEFQEVDPVRESHYSLQLPSGWEYKASWLNHAEVKPTQAGGNSWQWTVSGIPGMRKEPAHASHGRREGADDRVVLHLRPPRHELNCRLGCNRQMVFRPGRRTRRCVPGDQAASSCLNRLEDHPIGKDAGHRRVRAT